MVNNLNAGFRPISRVRKGFEVRKRHIRIQHCPAHGVDVKRAILHGWADPIDLVDLRDGYEVAGFGRVRVMKARQKILKHILGTMR